MTVRYPIPKLLRFDQTQFKALVKQAKTEGLSVSAFIRRAIERDLTFARRK